MDISKELREQLLVYQRNEITEHHIYERLAGTVKSPQNRRVLEKIAKDELRHYREWRTYTQQDVKPDKLMAWKYYLISRIFGFTFGIKLMERGEEDAQDNYEQLRETIPEAEAIIRDEKEHEDALIQLLDVSFFSVESILMTPSIDIRHGHIIMQITLGLIEV